MLAEIHGKVSIQLEDTEEAGEEVRKRTIERSEDVLTSNVFGTIKNVAPNVMNEILQKAQLPEIGAWTATSWKFWPRFEDGTIPDILIETDSHLLVVEVKYHSGFGRATATAAPQIIRELRGGLERAKPGQTVAYLTVTIDPISNLEAEIEKEFHAEFANLCEKVAIGNITWLEVSRSVLAPPGQIDNVTDNFLGDLHRYLEEKELTREPEDENPRPFEHFFPNSDELTNFLDEHAASNASTWRLSLGSLNENQKQELYRKITAYIVSQEANLASWSDNNIDLNRVGLGLLMDQAGEDFLAWAQFIRFLFDHEKVNLGGRDNISVTLRFRAGGYTKSVSLFTYLHQNQVMVFKQMR